MATIDAKIAQLQDKIQDIFVKQNIDDAIQDKVGNFALLVISGLLQLAHGALREPAILGAVQLVEKELEELCHCSRIRLGMLKSDKEPLIYFRDQFPELLHGHANNQNLLAICGPDESDNKDNKEEMKELQSKQQIDITEEKHPIINQSEQMKEKKESGSETESEDEQGNFEIKDGKDDEATKEGDIPPKFEDEDGIETEDVDLSGLMMTRKL
ncbi:MAG: hypothetical protein EZS28_013730 [Streblomastix strix]|uniref:Uncharacterized protein n=1 Tax=Streblomastix strix TaxID=222440 RepID=A0A5J4W7U8_9EUKA|nr:MAG: hypothetical protein EZS28_013730 [Streblomastix strix]